MTDVMERTFGPGETDDEHEDATEDAPQLSRWEGLEVTQSSIEIPGAAGGLRAAMKVDPFEGHKGERVFVVLECEVDKVRFDPVDKENRRGAQARVHILATLGATLVDEELVREALDLQAERIERAEEAAEAEKNRREELEGQQKLDVAAGETTEDEEQVDPTEPFLGYAELPASEVVARIETSGDEDEGFVSAIEAYEEATGGRAEILNAVKQWRDNGS